MLLLETLTSRKTSLEKTSRYFMLSPWMVMEDSCCIVFLIMS